MELYKKVLRTVRFYNMLDNEKVIIALSGGPDSVALLHILVGLKNSLNLEICAAHVNYKLRGKESDEDEKFCRNLCTMLGLAIYVKRINAEKLKNKTGNNLEDLCRKERYRFFIQLARKLGIKKIATGHTKSDLTETFFMKLFRGSGIKGIGSIYPTKKIEDLSIVRPLIDITRKEVMEFLNHNGIFYRIDRSNFSIQFTRNRIRHQLLPTLRNYCKTLEDKVGWIANNICAIEPLLETKINKSYQKGCKKIRLGMAIDIKTLQKLGYPLNGLLIKRISREISTQELSVPSIMQILELAYSLTEKANITINNINYTRWNGKLIAIHKDTILSLVKKDIKITVPGITKVPQTGLEIRTKIKQKRTFPEENPVHVEKVVDKLLGIQSAELVLTEQLDYDRIKEFLWITYRKKGDIFHPIGGKKRKLQDIFVDLKIPLWIRDIYPLIRSKQEIATVPGFRIGEAYKIRKTTKRVIEIKFIFR